MPYDHPGPWPVPTSVHPSELHTPYPSGYSYESQVPASTRQKPSELLEKYHGKGKDKFVWTNPNGALKKQFDVFFNYPNYVGRPIAVPVPVCGVDLVVDRPQVVVEFRDQDQEGPSTGVHVGYLYGKDTDRSRLQDAEDIVLEKLMGLDLKFVIAWPGYRTERFMLRVLSDGGRPLTRFDLAEQVTLAYALFFKRVEKERVLPSAVDLYNIALDQGEDRRSDVLGVQFMQLRLVRFRNASGGNWIADVEIV